MKFLLILLLCLPAFGQQREGDDTSKHIITLISRDDALAIYAGREVEKSDFVIFDASTPVGSVRGKEFVTFELALFATIDTANESREALISHLKMFIPEVKNICHEGVHRGEDCTVHHGRGILPLVRRTR